MAAMCLMVTLCGAADRSSAPQWTNADGITAADKAAIIGLAKRVGLGNPRAVSVVKLYPVGGAVVIIASEVEVSGARRTWRELSVCRRDWQCASDKGLRAGRWVSGAMRAAEVWRVTDDEWFVDVHLSDGVSFGTAERIVLAIRRQEVVNRLSTIFVGREFQPEVPVIDLSKVSTINRSTNYPGAYEVLTSDDGAGEVFTFRIEAGVVELHAMGRWIARLDTPPNIPLQPTSDWRRIDLTIS